MRVQWCLWLLSVVIATVALSLASCANDQLYVSSRSNANQPGHVITSSSKGNDPPANATSFSFSHGAQTPSSTYTIHTTTLLSKLRHGHQEFTINLANADSSLIIAFIGYSGPASYTLANRTNGGDVRITLGQQYWDLSLTPTASCSLTILSDIPTQQAGLDRMQGKFSCPTLPSGGLDKMAHTIRGANGTFDVLILVES
jgi:hypothetical protein